MKCTKKGVLRLSALAVAVMWGGTAVASTLSLNPTPAVITRPATDVVVTVNLAQTNGSNGADGIVNYDTASFNAAANALEGTCIVDDGTGRVIMSAGGFTNDRDICEITFTRDAAAADGSYPLTWSNVAFAAPDAGNDQAVDGSITIQSVNDAALAFTPPSGGTVNFAGGTQGDTSVASIDIDVTGTGGTGEVDNCVFSGADAAAFNVASTLPISVAVGGSDTLDLECVLDDVAQSATLTCDTTDGSGAGTASWTMACAAGSPIPAPEYSSNPAPDSTITCNGAPGATIARSITVENTGNPGAGEELDYSCSVTGGANFAIVGGASGTGLLVGDTATVQIECTAPAAAGDPANTDQITCTTNEAGAPTYQYGLSSSVVTAPPPVPQPNVVPAGSLWSKLLLIGLLAGLGGLIVAMRRQ